MSPSRKGAESSKSMGKVHLEVTMVPFFRPGVDDADDSSDNEVSSDALISVRSSTLLCSRQIGQKLEAHPWHFHLAVCPVVVWVWYPKSVKT